MVDICELLLKEPVIAAVRNKKDLNMAVESRAKIIFILFGNIINIAQMCEDAKCKDKYVFVHVDMIEGLKGDMSGIRYINEVIKPDGIITTKGANIKYARSIGMCVIQRVFIVDSMSLTTGIKNINDYRPDAVEIMPGIVPKAISEICSKSSIPLIAGGLINTKQDILQALSAGAVAISTSCSKIWNS